MKNQVQVVFGPKATQGTTDAPTRSVQNFAPVNTRTTENMASKNSVARATSAETSARTSRYRAPALEKGLDVIELLAAQKSPLNLSAVSQRLGRSSGELFRMLQVLEFKGFITTAENGTGYVLTNKLFALAMAQAPVRSLVETALPVMRRLAHDIGQSCHMTVASEDQIVVITRIERPGDLGFSVRIGYRREITRATSGLILFAYQDEETRRTWLKRCKLKGEAAESFVARADVVRERGHHEAASDFVRGIVDLSAPILRGDVAVAALVVPFVHSSPLVKEMNESVEFVRAAAKLISHQIAHGDEP
jgi:DNA-binding IclR family transcriptional regulator